MFVWSFGIDDKDEEVGEAWSGQYIIICTYFSYTVMSVHEVVKQILSCCYVVISFTAVCTIPVIGGVELGTDENEEWVGNGDDSFSAERKSQNG